MKHQCCQLHSSTLEKTFPFPLMHNAECFPKVWPSCSKNCPYCLNPLDVAVVTCRKKALPLQTPLPPPSASFRNRQIGFVLLLLFGLVWVLNFFFFWCFWIYFLLVFISWLCLKYCEPLSQPLNLSVPLPLHVIQKGIKV